VENELEHVRHYLSIQKLRYEGGFDYSFEVDKSILRCQCLKILLQPLVENSLKHGLTGIHTRGEILIRAYQSGDDVVLEVSDNGVGVDPAYIEALLAEDVGDDSSAEHTGYALRNVHKRLQLYYGEQYGLEVRSRPSGGASFLVSMPRTMNGSDALVSADNR
jgi:two-component system sensor histidine kinase YesM